VRRVTPVRAAPLIVLALVLGIGAATLAYATTHTIRSHHASPVAPATTTPTPSEIAAATAPAPTPTTSNAPMPTSEGVTAQIARLTKAPELGGRLLAQVLDAETGTVLYDKHGTTAGTPASVTKLLTAAAVLSVYPPTHRFTTTAVSVGDGTIVLVGGGDPTLTAAAPGVQPAYPDAGRLSSIAQQIKAAGITPTRIVIDTSLFTGPAVNPLWDPSDMGTSYGAPITALMVDGGRAQPSDVARSGSPDLAAGLALARLLGTPGLPVQPGTAPAGAKPIASVESAPLETIVGQMLVESDNVLADVLAHDVAAGSGKPASFSGAATATKDVLASKGVQIVGHIVDGSGLADADKLSPSTLAAVLRLIATDAEGPSNAVTGLPIGGLSGTLAHRYRPGTVGQDALGEVRAKTGTLTIVTSLAGYVHDQDGRLLIYAFISDAVAPGVYATRAAERAQDEIVTELSKCGCP
jgi:D-alanyl-D-alanine carboxypeptidase/D-alanyl-D-alanine-endopeptidase (penicillin-binding protein 4)